ncbi:MAG: SWIM zinc finger family protein [Bacteroidota bacterium]
MLTEQQVLSLAPDASSIKAGQKLALSSKWSRLERSDRAIWGEIKGSGKNPYQTRIDLKDMAFKCTCPSRKFPCKHGLALLLVYAKEVGKFETTEEPEWVSSWLDQRGQRAEKKQQKEVKQADPTAQAKRKAKREEKILDGLQELRQWTQDAVRNGLAQLPAQNPAYFERMAARMVDAQASGMAARIRGLQQINYQESGWQLQAMEKLSEIWTLSTAYPSLENLPQPVQEEVKTLIGWTTKKEEVLAKEGLQDKWQILGMEEYEDGRITVQKYWIKGKESGKRCFMLQFLVPGQMRSLTLLPGTEVEGSLSFYHHTLLSRAELKEGIMTLPITKLEGFRTIDHLQAELTKVLAQQPWQHHIPCVMEGILPIWEEEKFLLLDAHKAVMEIQCSDEDRWQIMAVSGGHPITLAGISSFNTFRPFGIMVNGRYQYFNHATIS